MDTTQEEPQRSILEIIGWRRRPDDAYEYSCGCGEWLNPTGQIVEFDDCYGPVVTVDDMLTWLRERTGEGGFVFGPDDRGGYFVFACWDDRVPQFSLDGEPRGWECEVRNAPTMLEALQATVRTVDELLS